jgi:hypothetical protein
MIFFLGLAAGAMGARWSARWRARSMARRGRDGGAMEARRCYRQARLRQPNAPAPADIFSSRALPQRPSVGDSVPADRRAPQGAPAPRLRESQRIAVSRSEPQRARSLAPGGAPFPAPPGARLERGPTERAPLGGACDDRGRTTETAAQAAVGRLGDGREARIDPYGVYRRRVGEDVPSLGWVICDGTPGAGRWRVGEGGHSVSVRAWFYGDGHIAVAEQPVVRPLDAAGAHEKLGDRVLSVAVRNEDTHASN